MYLRGLDEALGAGAAAFHVGSSQHLDVGEITRGIGLAT